MPPHSSHETAPHSEPAETLVHRDDWRPQGFGRGRKRLEDCVVEPSWNGVRVLVHVGPGSIRFIDEEGVDCTAEFGDLKAEVEAAVLAERMVLDGFLTVEPTQSTLNIRTVPVETPSGGELATQLLVGGLGGPRRPAQRRLDPDTPIAFVAVDMLAIDDADLLDVPLLERKRLLDGALSASERVRITPYVRPPAGTFAVTWRSLGFSFLAYKLANSRYSPGQTTGDWSIAPIPR